MKAIGDRIVIERIVEELKTGALTLNASDKESIRYKKGKIISKGSDISDLEDGNVILYDSAAGHTIMIDSSQYTIILRRDVAVVL